MLGSVPQKRKRLASALSRRFSPTPLRYRSQAANSPLGQTARGRAFELPRGAPRRFFPAVNGVAKHFR